MHDLKPTSYRLCRGIIKGVKQEITYRYLFFVSIKRQYWEKIFNYAPSHTTYLIWNVRNSILSMFQCKTESSMARHHTHSYTQGSLSTLIKNLNCNHRNLSYRKYYSFYWKVGQTYLCLVLHWFNKSIKVLEKYPSLS